MKRKAVLFDLDGTLLNTLDDIADAVNRTLALRGLPTHDREAYRWFIGDGARVLVTHPRPAAHRRLGNEQEVHVLAVGVVGTIGRGRRALPGRRHRGTASSLR